MASGGEDKVDGRPKTVPSSWDLPDLIAKLAAAFQLVEPVDVAVRPGGPARVVLGFRAILQAGADLLTHPERLKRTVKTDRRGGRSRRAGTPARPRGAGRSPAPR